MAAARDLALPLTNAPEGAGAGPGARRPVRGPTATFNYVAPTTRPYPPAIRFIRRWLFRGFMAFIFFGTFAILLGFFFVDEPWTKGWKKFTSILLKASIPVVSVCFTWWHVWLGLQMCWYPVEFCGIPPCLGWQGIVPRRASVMAGRACDIMIGRLLTIEEIIDRIEPDDFFHQLDLVIGETTTGVMTTICQRHWPNIWSRLSADVKAELKDHIVEESRAMFVPIIADIKENINEILDIKQMAIDILVNNKVLLVDMFQKIGSREFTFVLHVAAVMGFVCGIIQLCLWELVTNSTIKMALLPVSGLCIGYFTNWLAITMIFRPVRPHIICGGYINVQGVFLKRQAQVSEELTGMICEHLVYAKKMVEFLLQRREVDDVLKIYQRHMATAIEKSVGKAKILPFFEFEKIKEEVTAETLIEINKHTDQVTAYMDRTFQLKETIAPRLRQLDPEDFEGMLHPVFQEDEWMVLLLGGVLGVLVGTLQSLVLRGN